MNPFQFSVRHSLPTDIYNFYFFRFFVITIATVIIHNDKKKTKIFFFCWGRKNKKNFFSVEEVKKSEKKQNFSFLLRVFEEWKRKMVSTRKFLHPLYDAVLLSIEGYILPICQNANNPSDFINKIISQEKFFFSRKRRISGLFNLMWSLGAS